MGKITRNTGVLESASDTQSYTYIAKKGLSEELVRKISRMKNEPGWMLEVRLKALKQFENMPIPEWGANLKEIKWKEIHYYLRSVERPYKTWEEVPDGVRRIFDVIGVPEAEKELLSGVTGQYDSEKIYGSLKKSLAKKGVVFLSMDEGLRDYPELVKQYFGTIVPSGDNKLAALNMAVWSGGSFVYVPKGVNVGLPLQAYFRINAENSGQFERTLIVVEEGANVHYVEGCFPIGAVVLTNHGEKRIEDVKQDDLLLSHTGVYRQIMHIQKRQFTGDLYEIKYYGDSSETIFVTEEHPFLAVRRKSKNDRNKIWTQEWFKPPELKKGDYLAMPVKKNNQEMNSRKFIIKEWKGRKLGFEDIKVKVTTNKDFFRLVGYYLAEGSISSGSYLNFSFSEKEREYIDDVKHLINNVFGITKSYESHHKKNHGISVVFSSVELCRVFEKFGTHNENKHILEWMFSETVDKQRELLRGWFRGDGNYYSKRHKSGYKEAFRVNTTSKTLARQMVGIFRQVGIPAFLNARDRSLEGRRTMYTVGITGEWMIQAGNLFNINVDSTQNGKNRASMFGFDGNYVYVPIKSIKCSKVKNIDVYNFGVEKDESYVASGVVVHNCSAPAYSSASLHAAVVEVVVKPRAKCRYTTIQNWYKNVYNLVTKRAMVDANARMEWVDCNLGSKTTMKYPSCILRGEGASGEMLSIAVAGTGQHQDAGAKMIHLAPKTTSKIVSKSISRGGGRVSYRGLVLVGPRAKGARAKVTCDALILDKESRSDTYPSNRVMNNETILEHEAFVSRIGEEQLDYLMSRGLTQEQAETLIVRGFLEPVIGELPMEYAVELNRLVKLEMVGSVG